MNKGVEQLLSSKFIMDFFSCFDCLKEKAKETKVAFSHDPSQFDSTFISTVSSHRNGFSQNSVPSKINLILQSTNSERKRLIRTFVRELLLKKCAVNYIVQIQWTKRFSAFLQSNEEVFNKPLINMSLLTQDLKFKPGLLKRKHYVVLNQYVYSLIRRLFSIDIEICMEENQVRASSIRPFGLVNNQNFCYMNSGLQLLFSVDRFVNFFNSRRANSGQYCQATERIVEGMLTLSEPKNLVPLRELLESKFPRKQMQDCHQFIIYYLSKLEQELVSANLNNIVSELFDLKVSTTVTCPNCLHRHTVSSLQRELILPVESYCELQSLIKKGENGKLDDYWCEVCLNFFKDAKISINLLTLPQFLLISLKKYNSQGKRFAQLSFDHQLEVAGQSVLGCYELEAIVEHQGLSTRGHYTAHCIRQGRWFFLNDQRYREVPEQYVLAQQPYIMLYRKREQKALKQQ